MNRSLLASLVGALFVAGCSNPADTKKIEELEARIAALEQKAPQGLTKSPMVPDGANAADEQAAAELLKAASQATESMEYDTAKAKLAELKEKFPQTRAARAAARLDSELEIIGKEASASFEVEKWYQGNPSVGAGKAQMLVFWEVWCPHCKDEMPKLAKTYEKHQGEGFEIVGLTKQTRGITDEQVDSFIRDNSIGFPIGKEKGDAMSQYYGVRGIPAAAVVKGGKVVWRGHPARVTDEMIAGWVGG